MSELTLYIKDLLELDPELREVRLAGEIRISRGQHRGISIYPEGRRGSDQLRDVALGGRTAELEPEHGAAALARGRISVYLPRGSYQLYVDELQPEGLGDLHARFEDLKERLGAEGFFEADRKRPLPEFPRVMGIVTSPQAAALRDVLNVLRRRYPLVQVLLSPAMVQGDQAPPQIVAALQALDARDDVDVILLVRGGGSLEDLWAFNDERVARAIAACRHPVVSGVGHETDFTIADFVADLRAPTPSAAAELAVPDRADLQQQLATDRQRLARSMDRLLSQMHQALQGYTRSLASIAPGPRGYAPPASR